MKDKYAQKKGRRAGPFCLLSDLKSTKDIISSEIFLKKFYEIDDFRAFLAKTVALRFRNKWYSISNRTAEAGLNHTGGIVQMRNSKVLVTSVLEKSFGFADILEDRGFDPFVFEEGSKSLVEEINRLKPGAVLLPVFLAMQDAVSIINIAKQMCEGCDDTLYFVMGGGEGMKTINYIVNNGADYYFHITTSTVAVVEKMLSFFDEDYEQTIELFAEKREGHSDRDMVTRELLRETGVLPHLKGFLYLSDAAVMGIECQQWPIPLTRTVYPALAEKFETTQLRVERAMRNAILVAWANFDKEKDKKNPIFSKCQERPSNREFLGLVNYELKKRLADNPEYGGQSVG